MPIPIARLTMRRRYMHSVLTQLVDEEVGPGKTTRELVGGLAAHLGLPGGVALSSAYTAIIAAAETLGLAPRDRIVVPALAPSVYLDALSSRGLEVCLADVDPQSGAVSPEALRTAIAGGARAVVVHHTLGLTMASDPAREAGIPTIEDITMTLPSPPDAGQESPGLETDGGPHLLLVTLDAGGLLNAGGGAVLLARRKSQIPGLKTAAGNASVHQQLPSMNAALALAQLGDLETDRTRRREITLLYRAALRRSRHEALGVADGSASPVSLFPVRLKDSMAEVRQYARKHGVETRPAFEDACAAQAPDRAQDCPNARRLVLSCLAFPLYPMLTRKDAETVCRVLATLP